jgi:hypothetical protein
VAGGHLATDTVDAEERSYPMDDRRKDSEGSDPQANQSQTSQGRQEKLRAAFQLLALALGPGTFDPTRPDHGRASVRNALIGVIAVIAELFPDKPSLPATLNHLLYALWDLDRGKVAPLLQPAKIEHSPGLSLSEDLFRALPSAAMTRLMEGQCAPPPQLRGRNFGTGRVAISHH